MTLNPILSWWVMGPLAAAIILGLGWVLVRSRQRSGPSGDAGFRGWLFRGGLVLLLLLAACRPGFPGGTVEAAATDLNVFFVVDTSSSTAAEDHVPAGGPAATGVTGGGDAAGGQAAGAQAAGVPRLDGVREDIRAIARELGGARYSLISFDSSASVRMPLTTDTSALETAVAVLGPEVTDYSQGSSVTAARAVLAERLAAARESHPDRPRLVFYFGDGEQTSAAAPQSLGIDGSLVNGGAVLGYGTRDGGRMKENSGDPTRPAATYIQDPATGAAAVSRLDEDRLRDLARQLALPYLHRAAGDAAAPMLQQATPGTLVRTGVALDGRTEVYWAPAFAAFLLALRETLLVFGQLRELRPARPARPVRPARPARPVRLAPEGPAASTGPEPGA